MDDPLLPVWEWFLRLHQESGINLSIFYDQIDRERFLTGIVVTLKLSIVCIVISVVIGIVGAWLRHSSGVWVRMSIQAYVQFFRNTPPIVQLYFFYFAVDKVLSDALGQEYIMGSFGWAALSLSFFAGSFNVEIFRAGVEAVPRSTIQAAEALGYSRLGVYRFVILPLAFRICLPALGSNLINLVKTTTIAYTIAVPETLYVANQIWSEMYNVPEMMNVVWLVYIIYVSLLVWLLHRMEKKFRLKGYGD